MASVKAGNEFLGVVFEELEGVLAVDLHPGAKDVGVHIVGPFFNEGAPLDPLDELFDIFYFQNEDRLDLDIFFQKVRLAEGPGDAIEEEKLLGGEIAVRRNQAMHIVVPDLDRHFIGQKEPFSGVIVIELPGGGFRRQAPENIAGREMEMVPCAAEEFAQSPFS